MLQLEVDHGAIERYEESIRPNFVAKWIRPNVGRWLQNLALGSITLFFIGIGCYVLYWFNALLQSKFP